MRPFARRHPHAVLLTLILAASLGLLSLPPGRPVPWEGLHAAIVRVTAGAQAGLVGAAERVAGVWEGYVDLVGLAEENRRLREDLARLHLERQALGDAAQVAERLEAMLSYTQALPYQVVGARIVGQGATHTMRSAWVDRGAAEGITRDQPVVVPQGLIGRVRTVHEHYSQILFLNDPASAVDAVVTRSGDVGIVRGTLGSMLEMRYLSPRADVQVGDEIRTLGIAGIFPRGLPVGTVRHVRPGAAGVFLDVEVEPAVAFRRVRELLILVGGWAPPEEARPSAR